jgi:hypothetical protein
MSTEKLRCIENPLNRYTGKVIQVLDDVYLYARIQWKYVKLRSVTSEVARLVGAAVASEWPQESSPVGTADFSPVKPQASLALRSQCWYYWRLSTGWFTAESATCYMVHSSDLLMYANQVSKSESLRNRAPVQIRTFHVFRL